MKLFCLFLTIGIVLMMGVSNVVSSLAVPSECALSPDKGSCPTLRATRFYYDRNGNSCVASTDLNCAAPGNNNFDTYPECYKCVIQSSPKNV